METRPAPAGLEVRLLGPLEVRRDGLLVDGFPSQRARLVLVAVLVATEPLQRGLLADWLWPDRGQKVARTNLRVALHGLRKLLGDRIGGDRSRLWWEPEPGDRVDLHRLREALGDGGSAVEGIEGPVAIALGLDLDGCEVLEGWLEGQREDLVEAVARAWLARGVERAESGSFAAAEVLARRVLELDPIREEAHRLLLRALSATAQRSAIERHRRAIRSAFPGAPPPGLLSQLVELAGRVPTPTLGFVPSAGDAFVGRVEESGRLRELLEGGRLVTLVGLGGAGKTRLSMAVAGSLQPRDGVWFVELAAVQPGDVASVIAQTLGLLLPGRGDPTEGLIEALRDREVLLVLDNAEVVEDEVAELASRLIARAPAVRILVSSRRPLRLRAERVLALEGLSAGPEGEAMALFVARDPSAASDPDLSALIEALGGMPLGIELCASQRARLGSARAVLERLSAVVSDERDRPERHRSLDAALEGTWTLLEPEEQALLARLGSFRGSFDPPALALAEADARRLGALVEASLVQRSGERLLLHPLVQGFARARQSDPEGARVWHRERVFERVAMAVQALLGPGHAAATDRLKMHRADYLAAWDGAVVAGEQADVEAHAPILVEAADAMGWTAAAELRLVQALDRWPGSEPLLRGLAWVSGRLGQVDRGLELLDRCARRDAEWHHYRLVLLLHAGRLVEARAAAEAAGPPTRSREWNARGLLAQRTGDPDRAERCFEAGLAAITSETEGRAASLLHGLATTARFRGDLRRARELHQRALALRRKFLDPRGLALTLGSLAACEAMAGELDSAREHLLEARRLAWDIGDPPARALAEHNLGCLELSDGDPIEGEGRLEAAIAIRTRLGDRVGLAYSLAARGEACARQGRLEQAARDLTQAEALAAEVEDARLSAQVARHRAAAGL